MAASAESATLSRYQESGERLTTPIIEGRALNSKRCPLKENSRTLLEGSSPCCSQSRARFSSISMSERARRGMDLERSRGEEQRFCRSEFKGRHHLWEYLARTRAGRADCAPAR